MDRKQRYHNYQNVYIPPGLRPKTILKPTPSPAAQPFLPQSLQPKSEFTAPSWRTAQPMVSGSPRKRGMGDNFPYAGDNQNAKMRKDDGQPPCQTEPFHFLDELIWELRSAQGFGGQVNVLSFGQILERLKISETLIKTKQANEQSADTVADPKLRVLMEYITEMNLLVKEYVGNANKPKFEELMDKMGSDERLFRRQTKDTEVSNSESENFDVPQLHERSHPDLNPSQLIVDGDRLLSSSSAMEKSSENEAPIPMKVKIVKTNRHRSSPSEGKYTSDESSSSESSSDEDSNCESETNDNPRAQQPLQQELYSSQANEQAAANIEHEEQLEHLNPDAPNVHASAAGAVREELPELSNRLNNEAQINFNTTLMKKLNKFCYVSFAVEIMLNMIKKRTTIITNAQYEYSLPDHQLFNEELLTKLRVFGKEVSPKSLKIFNIHNMPTVLQELIDMLQSDDMNLRPYYAYLTDFYLLKCIASNSDSVSTQHILRSRTLKLNRLHLGSKFGIVQLSLLESHAREYCAGGCDDTYRRFEYGMNSNMVDGVDSLKLFNIILKFYDVSQASILLNRFGNISGINFHVLESTFGSPPNDHNDKIQIQRITVESPEMIDFLHWFCPQSLWISCDPLVLIDKPSLISGVKVLTFENMNVDRFMENCTFPVMLHWSCTWSKESFFRVLTAHMLSAGNGRRRSILCKCHSTGTGINTIDYWKELFDSWSRDFEANHGNIGRKVTLSAGGSMYGSYGSLMLH